MAIRTPTTAFTLLAFVAAAALGAVPLRAHAGDGEVAFPRNFGVHYATVDRAEFKQRRELHAPAAAIAAVKQGQALPSATVLIMVQYAIKRDGEGKPIVDADGRFIRDRLIATLVMEKGSDTGDPDAAAQGNWRFQMFGADGRVKADVNLKDCVACHQQRRAHDFVFSGDRMKAFSEETAAR